jgi:hypothetical protein
VPVALFLAKPHRMFLEEAATGQLHVMKRKLSLMPHYRVYHLMIPNMAVAEFHEFILSRGMPCN